MTSRTGVLLLILGLSRPALPAEDAPLSLADLEAYRLALKNGADPSAPRVRFRDLWDHPDEYLGRPVRVEGRMARVFHQPRLGEFPPLTEAWVVSEAGDPFCLVFPIVEGQPGPGVGASVGFVGTFLKRLRYQGGDVDRVAPLIVGPEVPSSTNPASSPAIEVPVWSTADWLMGLGAASMVAMVLARRHLSRPASDLRSTDPPPRFVDREDGDGEHRGDAGGTDDEEA